MVTGFYKQNNESLCIQKVTIFRGGSRTAASSKMEVFVIIVNGF